MLKGFVILTLPYIMVCSVAKAMDFKKITLNESEFRFQHNNDAMAVDKLAEGIRKFSEDTVKLEKLIRDKLSS